MPRSTALDALVIGAGPAGLSAALLLARARCRVLVVDSGEPRNARSRGVRGFLSRDGILPERLRGLGRAEAERYGARIQAGCAVGGELRDGLFEVRLATGRVLRARKLVLATGLRDRLPRIPGVDRRYGTSVHHCPYCDGYEHRDQPLALYARGRAAVAVARKLLAWTSDVVVLTDGPTKLTAAQRAGLERLGVRVVGKRLRQLEGRGRSLERIRFVDGSSLERRGLFFSLGFDQRSQLAEDFGCRFTDSGCVLTDRRGESATRGLFVVGDASRDTQMAIVAAAEGARAAIRLHEELIEENLAGERPASGAKRPRPTSRPGARSS